jgi:hypothetical protein
MGLFDTLVTDPLKRVAGTYIGGIGGVFNNTALRDIGGQLTGGIRNYSIVPEAHAAEGEVLGTSTNPINTGMQSNPSAPQSFYSGPSSFGDPNNPDLSNPDKVTDYNAWKASQGTGSSGPSAEELYAQSMRNQIGSGYDSYFSQLDAMIGGLSDRRTAQEGIANTSYNTNLTDLGLQKESNQADLNAQGVKTEQNQVKTLKDISSNIRNLMNAGNTYLGSMGAGDSSAVNQYAYGLTKLGSQQRGDVQTQTAQILSDIADRGSKLNNVYMQEKNRLAGEKDTAIQQIAADFSDAQIQLQQAKANGQLAKSQDLQTLTTNLYNTAVKKLTDIDNAFKTRTSQLETWAMNNSTNLSQLKQNMASIGAFQAPKQTTSQISGTPQVDSRGNISLPYGGSGTSTEELKKLFGLA